MVKAARIGINVEVEIDALILRLTAFQSTLYWANNRVNFCLKVSFREFPTHNRLGCLRKDTELFFNIFNHALLGFDKCSYRLAHEGQY